MSIAQGDHPGRLLAALRLAPLIAATTGRDQRVLGSPALSDPSIPRSGPLTEPPPFVS